jgi:hypothetical protein
MQVVCVLALTWYIYPILVHKTHFRNHLLFGSSLVVCGERISYLRYLCLFVYSGVQHILCCVFVFLRLVYPILPVTMGCFCFVFLRLVYPILPVTMGCFCFVFLRLVYPILTVTMGCFCFVFLRLVYPILPVTMGCPFLITPSVFYNVFTSSDALKDKRSENQTTLVFRNEKLKGM